MTLIRRQLSRPSLSPFTFMADIVPSQPRSHTSTPADLYETADGLVLEMAVPGLNAESLEVSALGRTLTISGRFAGTDGDIDGDTDSDADSDGRRYYLRSLPRGDFRRTVTLPTGVDTETVTAKLQDGLLHVSLPKVAAAQARKIAITTS